MYDINLHHLQWSIPWLIPAIFAAGSAIQQAIVARRQRKNQEAQNRFNQQQADIEYQKNLDMWNKANEYNTPQSQMSRLSQAGLNPNLVYGGGNVAGNQSATLPKYNAPEGQFQTPPMVNLPEMLSTYMNFRQQKASVDAINQQTENNKLKAGLSAFELGFLNKNQPQISRYRMDTMQGKAQGSLMDAYRKQSLADMTDMERRQYEQVLQLKRGTLQSQIAGTQARTQLTKYQATAQGYINQNRVRLMNIALQQGRLRTEVLDQQLQNLWQDLIIKRLNQGQDKTGEDILAPLLKMF